MKQKYQQFFPHTARSLLCIQFVAVTFQSNKLFEEGDLYLPLPSPKLINKKNI